MRRAVDAQEEFKKDGGEGSTCRPRRGSGRSRRPQRRGFVDRYGQEWRQTLEAAIDAEDTEVAG